MAENWWLIVVVLLVIGIGLWWLLGKPKDAAKPPVVDKAPKPLVREEAPPVIPLPTASPVDVPPPPPVEAPAKVTPAKVAPAKATSAKAKPAAKPAPKPAAKAAAAPARKPAPTAEPDNLLLLKGVGPKLVTLLASLGVTRFDQIAGWTAADIAAIDEKLGTFKGRATRDQWVEQAAFLAKGDRAGFEAKFGKLEG